MDNVSKKTRSYIMSRIRSKSGIEVLPLRFRGLYLRKHPAGVFGNPDFGNKTSKIALFIDGDFWHGNPRTFRMPKSNVTFWRDKITANRRRDRKVNRTLMADGWTVVRIWESDLMDHLKKDKRLVVTIGRAK